MRKRILLLLIIAVAVGISAVSAFATVKPMSMFSSNAVFQRGIPIPVWGTGDNGEEVSVEFKDQVVTTKTVGGKWKVKLDPSDAGGPYTMTITGKDNTIRLTNVMVGEVWACGGQSNMHWWLKEASTGKEAIAKSEDPMLRLFDVPRIALDAPATDVQGSWKAATPDTTPDFSAVGYFFGRELRRKLNIPVGLINCNQGATMAEAWMPMDVIKADPEYRKVLDTPWPKDQELLRPAGLYNGMVAPIAGYPMRGVIWYQGESNAWQAHLYRRVFPAMIQSWRDKWGEGKFPFLFVQLAPYEFEAVTPDPKDSAWAELREAQLFTAEHFPNTGMAVITDVGDPKDIHPKDKETVGKRLALIAQGRVYHQKVEYYGPLYKSMKVKDGKAVISFTHIGKGLMAKDGALKGFAIAGDDHKFVWADAVIKGKTVVVSSPKVAKPIAVRYGWANNPEVNLFNKNGQPASPFRTDDFQMLTGPKK